MASFGGRKLGACPVVKVKEGKSVSTRVTDAVLGRDKNNQQEIMQGMQQLEPSNLVKTQERKAQIAEGKNIAKQQVRKQKQVPTKKVSSVHKNVGEQKQANQKRAEKQQKILQNKNKSSNELTNNISNSVGAKKSVEMAEPCLPDRQVAPSSIKHDPQAALNPLRSYNRKQQAQQQLEGQNQFINFECEEDDQEEHERSLPEPFINFTALAQEYSAREQAEEKQEPLQIELNMDIFELEVDQIMSKEYFVI